MLVKTLGVVWTLLLERKSFLYLVTKFLPASVSLLTKKKTTSNLKFLAKPSKPKKMKRNPQPRRRELLLGEQRRALLLPVHLKAPRNQVMAPGPRIFQAIVLT